MTTSSRPLKELPAVGAERALKVLGGRWKLVLIWTLYEGPRRLRDLEAALPGASQKVLLDQLRELEAHGLVERTADPPPSARGSYSITPLGRTVQPLILELCAWGRLHERASGEASGGAP